MSRKNQKEPDIPGDGGSSSVNISRSDAIKLYKNRIATLKLVYPGK